MTYKPTGLTTWKVVFKNKTQNVEAASILDAIEKALKLNPEYFMSEIKEAKEVLNY